MPLKYLNILDEDEAVKNKKTNKNVADKLTPDFFKSPLLIIAEVMLIIGAIFSLVSLIRLVDPTHRQDIINGIVAQNIVDPEAITTWFYIIIIGKMLFSFFEVTFSVGLAIAIVTAARSKGDTCKIRGLGFLSAVNNVTVWIWFALLGVAGIVFLYRIVVYTVDLLKTVVDFVFPLAAVLAGEAVMILILVGITTLLVMFWRALADLATHLRYMLYTGNLDSHIEPIAYVALFILAVFSGYLVYFFLYDPIAVVSFAALAVASVLLGICIRVLKSRVEWMHFLNYERKKSR